MPTRPPEFVEIPLGKIERWGKNPRSITPDMLQKLAASISKYGMFQTLTVWKEGEKIVAGGGNMRHLAMVDVLHYSPDRKILCSMNYPSSEAEKIELSFLDNQAFGFYSEFETAELIKPLAEELDLGLLRVSFSEPKSLEEVLAQLAASASLSEASPNEKDVDENINRKNKCPSCGYEW